MTRDEFREWLNAYAAMYHIAHRYLTDPIHGKARAEQWFAELGHLDVEAAADAVAAMRSDPRPVPFEPGEHPARILEHAQRLATRQAVDPLAEQRERAERELYLGCRRLRQLGLTMDEYFDRVDMLYDKLGLPKSSAPAG